MAKKKQEAVAEQPVVCKVVDSLKDSLVPIGSLKTHPKNPRVGNINAIAESLQEHSQYRAIVARVSDRTVLAGNHTFKAAQHLGWTHVAVDWVDVDDAEATRIMLADNRTGDVAKVDNEKLLSFLDSLPDVKGTGYDDGFMNRLRSTVDSASLFNEKLEVVQGHKTVKRHERYAAISIGGLHYKADLEAFVEWVKTHDEEFILKALEWPTYNRTEADAEVATAPVVESDLKVDGEEVPIKGLKCVPGTPRVPNVEKIAESLRANGQYRRIVINKRDSTVLVNWGVVLAAKKLGWKTVVAITVDVDPIQAQKIHLADNRCAELARYEELTLAQMLQSLNTPFGTGYSPKEVKQLFDEAGVTKVIQVDEQLVYLMVKCAITKTNWHRPARRPDYDAWYTGLLRKAKYSDSGVMAYVIDRLGIELKKA